MANQEMMAKLVTADYIDNAAVLRKVLTDDDDTPSYIHLVYEYEAEMANAVTHLYY